MRETQSSPHDQLVKLLAKAQARIESEINAVMQSEGQFSIQHWLALKELSTTEGASMGAIQKGTAINDSTLTKTVDRLVSEGLAYRRSDDKDRRKVVIFLSSKGQKLVKKAGAKIDRRQEDIFPDLPVAKMNEVQAFLTRILD